MWLPAPFSIAAAASAGGAVTTFGAFAVTEDVLVVGALHLVGVGLHDAVGQVLLLVGTHRVPPAAAQARGGQPETNNRDCRFQKNTANPPEYSWRFSVEFAVNSV
jgi:hypothetical protein